MTEPTNLPPGVMVPAISPWEHPVTLCVIFMLILYITAATGYYFGHRACQAPVSARIAHDSTTRAIAAQKVVEKTVLVADTALVKALASQNAHLVTQRDAALAQLQALAVQQRGPIVQQSPAIDTGPAPAGSAMAAVDTLRVALAQCDTLAQSCSVFRSDAVKKFAADSLVERSLTGEIAAYRAAQPTIWHQISIGLRGAVVGALGGFLLARR